MKDGKLVEVIGTFIALWIIGIILLVPTVKILEWLF
jgi:hypothetical protein